MNMPALKYSQIHQGFYSFINEDVLPACGIEGQVFWQEAESLISDFLNAKNDFIETNTTSTIAANSARAAITDKEQLIEMSNQRWTSIFASNSSVEVSKAYLDQHFALETGSHTQVKNYVVYYHHLLAFFEDGSQSGLANPSQFVALCGHKCAPDSIVLKYLDHDLHIELVFDRKGGRGRDDNAGIENIMVETNDTIIADFSAIQVDGESKVQAYRNLQNLLQGRLQTHTMEKGKQRVKRLQTEISFTDVNGDDYVISQQTPLQVRCSQTELQTDLIRSKNGELAPQFILDAIVASLLLSVHGTKAQHDVKTPLLMSGAKFTDEMLKRLENITTL